MSVRCQDGLLGSQLREQTDELAITAEMEQGIGREKWGEELGATIIYKIHRSFSWSLLLTSGLLFFWMTREKDWQAVEPRLIFAMVVAMMLMGVVLGHIAIYPIVQDLHVGMTSVTWHWIMRLWSTTFRFQRFLLLANILRCSDCTKIKTTMRQLWLRCQAFSSVELFSERAGSLLNFWQLRFHRSGKRHFSDEGKGGFSTTNGRLFLP